jgi:hypothetical protein
MRDAIGFVLGFTPLVLVGVLAFVAWLVMNGLHQLHNSKIAPQPPARLAELRESGKSNLYTAAFGFAAVVVVGGFYFYGPAVIDWFFAA